MCCVVSPFLAFVAILRSILLVIAVSLVRIVINNRQDCCCKEFSRLQLGILKSTVKIVVRVCQNYCQRWSKMSSKSIWTDCQTCFYGLSKCSIKHCQNYQLSLFSSSLRQKQRFQSCWYLHSKYSKSDEFGQKNFVIIHAQFWSFTEKISRGVFHL